MIPYNLKYPPISLGSPGEEIRQQDIAHICQRFKNLHLLRLLRIQELLSTRQQDFINLLPVIFHLNHPLLPGFISAETVAGISGFELNQVNIASANRFADAFAFQPCTQDNFPIYGVFLMGSVSSIAFSKTSDMDVWICHQAGLSRVQLDGLKQKARAVEKWAQTLGLEVHIFLVDNQAFLDGKTAPISTESSGATQHYLLLEEFYRTAIYLAGRIPVWWVVPPQEELNYTRYVHYLKQQNLVSESEIIDFGGFENVPADEFIGATLWHLYKAINSPYKSLLKLMLMECYASEYPDPDWLCLNLKTSVYQGVCNIDDLDPYLQIYQKIERYLQPFFDLQRLNLVRQSFYIKIMGLDSDLPENTITKERQLFLQKVAEKWEWSSQEYNSLTRSESWGIANAVREHESIMSQIYHCYRTICGFAGNYIEKGYQEHEDIKLIGRKLYTLLDRKPGKIDVISTRSIIHQTARQLSIREIVFASGDKGWGLYQGDLESVKTTDIEPIKKAWSLLEVLAWLVINGFYHETSNIQFSATSIEISPPDVQLVVGDLQKFLQKEQKLEPTSLDVYKHGNNFTLAMLIINFGQAWSEQHHGEKHIANERSNVLSCGADKHCFVVSTDQVSFSSWGEVITHRYEGIEGLFHCLLELINNHQPLTPSQLDVHCYNPLWIARVILQIKRLYATLVRLFADSTELQAPRFIIAGEQNYYLFQDENDQLTFSKIENNAGLMTKLAQPQKIYSPVLLGDEVLKDSVMPAILPYNQPQVIQIFSVDRESGVEIYILDEKGSLFFQGHQNSTVNHLFSAYSIFLQSLIERGALEQVQGIEYYEVYENAKGLPECGRVHHKPTPMNPHFDLRIAGKELNPGQIIYTILCNGVEFSTMEHGTPVFRSTAKYILSQRQESKDYPIHITDIDVPSSAFGLQGSEENQTIHFLYQKKQIEYTLNNQ